MRPSLLFMTIESSRSVLSIVWFTFLCSAVPALALLAHRDEIPVQTAGFHQFLVGAGLGDPAVRDHQDLVGVPDGVQPVGNDKQCLSLAQLADGLLDVALVVGVHAGGSLVQNNNGGVF